MGLIAGIYSYTKDLALTESLQKMMRIQSHRDRSFQITYSFKHLAIGMCNRHNVLFYKDDIKLNSKDNNIEKNLNIYAIVDGIVLDAQSQKRCLVDMGICADNLSSSSIVAAAYAKWGMDFMKHLEGEFACAVWDKNKNIIILARDLYGHKPLHYYYKNNKLLFSSEIKGILAGGATPEINLLALNDFLSLSHVPNPDTIFKNIYQVSPGEMVVLQKKCIKKIKYWQHKIEIDKTLTIDEAETQFEGLLRAAIKKRMVNSETYCFLSGGIDSSAILALATELSSTPVHALCVGFDDSEFDESDDAEIMANHVGAKFTKVTAKPESFYEMLDKLIYHHDIPFYDTSAIPTFYAAKLARSYTDVILTGDGPDQSLGGQEQILSTKKVSSMNENILFQSLARITSEALGFFIKDITPTFASKLLRWLYKFTNPHDTGFFPYMVKKFLCTEEFLRLHMKSDPFRHVKRLYEENRHLDNLSKRILKDIHFYVADGLMVKVDRMCMANELETLSPFQDKHLSELISKMPASFKININNGTIMRKYILTKVCRKYFPKRILEKRNQGFAIPLVKWLKHDNGKYLKEILLDETTYRRGYFKKDSLENVVNTFLDDKGDWYYPNPAGIFSLLTIELWNRKYIDSKIIT